MGITGRCELFSSLESWAGSLGYVVELHDGRFFVSKDEGKAECFSSEEDVVDFILGMIRNSCCGGL